MNRDFWRGRSVLVTGHTGFKGAWLSLWLSQLEAEVHGLALDPPTQPNLYEASRISALLASDRQIDIRNYQKLGDAITQVKPEIIFHLAAQSLVTCGYQQPVETYATNIMGTVHVLEASRQASSVQAIIVITTDKCYENQDWVYPYREGDRLGGSDPYSSSKACAELVVSAYRSSFLESKGVAVATARAGNVIGGGDWAVGRLIPDCVRAFQTGAPLKLRYPHAVRPWQHVLEPLSGYLLLAEAMLGDRRTEFCSSWNFGPDAADTRTVSQVVKLAAEVWGSEVEIAETPPVNYETGLLQLDSSKARSLLGWQPRWSFSEAVKRSIVWYVSAADLSNARDLTLEEIAAYEEELVR